MKARESNNTRPNFSSAWSELNIAAKPTEEAAPARGWQKAVLGISNIRGFHGSFLSEGSSCPLVNLAIVSGLLRCLIKVLRALRSEASCGQLPDYPETQQAIGRWRHLQQLNLTTHP